MQLLVIQRILGLLLMIFSSSLLPPVFIGIYYADGAVEPFVEAFALTLAFGLLLYICILSIREVFWPNRVTGSL